MSFSPWQRKCSEAITKTQKNNIMITGYKERWPVIIFINFLSKIKVAFKSVKRDKNEIILPKCKRLYANKREIVDEMPISVTAWSFKSYIFKLTKCEDAKFFSDSALRSFLRNSLGDSVDGAAAYSYAMEGVRLKYLLLNPKDELSEAYIFLAAATQVFSEKANIKKTVIRLGDKEISVRQNEDFLVISKRECDFFNF